MVKGRIGVIGEHDAYRIVFCCREKKKAPIIPTIRQETDVFPSPFFLMLE